MENRKENQEQKESRISKLNEEEKKYISRKEKKNKESNFMSKHLIKGLKRDLCVYDTNAD